MVLADVNSAGQRPKPFFIISQKVVGDSAKEKRYNLTKRKGTHLRASNFRLGQHHQGGGRSFLQNLMYGKQHNISLAIVLATSHTQKSPRCTQKLLQNIYPK
jgi:hypothetical protein